MLANCIFEYDTHNYITLYARRNNCARLWFIPKQTKKINLPILDAPLLFWWSGFDFGEETSLLMEALACVLTVTFADICWGCELAVDVVNSSCWTISTENLVRPSLGHWSFTGGSKLSFWPPPWSSSSADRFRNFCCNIKGPVLSFCNFF